MTTLRDIWHGFLTGLGVELSFLLLWVMSKLAHSKIAHKFHAEHWFHTLVSYFE